MSGETWIAIVAALIAAAALYFNWQSTRAAVRAARAAEAQTAIQQQLREDAAQPYVWADLRPDDSTGQLLNLVVGNSGPTVAEKVRVKVQPPIPTSDRERESTKAAKAVLTDGIESLPPGRVLQWTLGLAGEFMNGPEPKAFKFTVTANGPFGAIPALTYIVDVSNMRETLDRPTGSLHWLTRAVQGLTKKIGEG